MDSESLASLAFLLFALGFFLFCINMVTRDENTRYSRWREETASYGMENTRIYRPNTHFHRRIPK